jgi:hypothetical protein
MHIAIVVSASEVTQFESRLIKRIVSLPAVRVCTILLVDTPPSLIAILERLRILAEFVIARTGFIKKDLDGVRNIGLRTECVKPSDVGQMLRDIKPDRVIQLVPELPITLDTRDIEIFQLWWDSGQPSGIGTTRASGAPPHCLTVTSFRYGDHFPQVVEQSHLSPMPGAIASGRYNAVARSFTLLIRALRHETTNQQKSNWRMPEKKKNGFQSIATGFQILDAIVCDLTDAVVRRISRILWRRDSWYIAYRTKQQNFVTMNLTANSQGFVPYRSGYDSFVADPICVSHDGIDCVFFEEFSYEVGRGLISCAVLQSDGTLGEPQRVLERPYHLSYPFVFHHGEAIYMIPETAGNRTIELYRCVHFPDKWVFEMTLLSDIIATDATLYNDGVQWWMFTTVGEDGSYTWDELHIFMSASPKGPWTPHPGNPVKCDARSSRPAGPLFWRGNHLIRPTQDCSLSYGGAINLCEIEVLTPLHFTERVVDRIPASWFRCSDGLHTICASDRLEVIDVRPKYRFRWTRGTQWR